MNGCCLDAKSRQCCPFAVPGDDGMAYLEWGAVPECLKSEVTGLVCTAYRKHASSRKPDANQQTFPGWQQSTAPSSSSSSQAPWPGPRDGFSPCARSLSGTGMPVGHLGSSPPKDPAGSCFYCLSIPTNNREETTLLSSPRPPPPLEAPGAPMQGASQCDPFHVILA